MRTVARRSKRPAASEDLAASCALRHASSQTGSPATGAALEPAAYRVRVLDAMDDDFSTPQALAALFDLAREINRAGDEGRGVGDAQRTLRILGSELLGFSFEEREVAVAPELVERIEELVGRRTALRSERKFAEADALRDELAAMSVVLTDTAAGPTWRVEASA